MKKKGVIFITLNSVFYLLLWLIQANISVRTGNTIFDFIKFIGAFLIILFNFGGEFLICTFYSYKLDYKINFGLLIYCTFINISIIKLTFPSFDFKLIILFILNQILGLLFGNILLTSEIRKRG